MNVTEVRVKLIDDTQERLKAFCSITLDNCFVVRDLKIIAGDQGLFVAMPSRKLTDRCGQCGHKNCLRARYCEQCGVGLAPNRQLAPQRSSQRAKLYADIAHPINARCREDLEQQILSAFEHEILLSQQPGYVCRYDDYGEETVAALASDPERNGSNGHAERRPSANLGQRLQ